MNFFYNNINTIGKIFLILFIFLLSLLKKKKKKKFNFDILFLDTLVKFVADPGLFELDPLPLRLESVSFNLQEITFAQALPL